MYTIGQSFLFQCMVKSRAFGISSMKHVDNMDIITLCKKRNLRLTGPRLVILRILSSIKDHPDAVELHQRVTEIEPGISLATVYRTLKLLEKKGILEKHSFGNGPARFERADQEHHDHLINVETGDVIEFRSDEIEKLQEDIARKLGFSIVSHRLEIYVRPLAKIKNSKYHRNS